MSRDEAFAAGQAAMREGRWLDARAAFEAVLAEEESPAALAGLGDTHFWTGGTRQAIAYRERAYGAFRRAGDVFGAAESAIWLAIAYSSGLGNLPAARGWLARAKSVVGDADPGPMAGWFWLLHGLESTDLEDCREHVERAVALGRDFQDIDLELCALSELGVILVQLGEREAGLRHVDEAMAGALGGEAAMLDTVVYASCSMLTACDLLADLDRATQWSRAIDDFTRVNGGPFLYAYCRVVYGRVLMARGQWIEAAMELGRAIEATRGDFPAMHAHALAALAELRLYQGRLDEASAIAEAIDDPIEAALPLARVALRRGEPALAITFIERWLGSAADHSPGPAHARGELSIEGAPALALLVEAHAAAGNAKAATEVANSLATLADEGATGLSMAYAALSRGRAAAASGANGLARHCLEEAVARFGRLEIPLETAAARLDLARVLASDRRDVAVAEARAALSAFERLGASGHADEAAALLRSWGVAGRTGPRDVGVLSQREQEVLALIASGLSNQEIALRLYISRKTASHHVSNVLSKLGLRNRTEAAAYAARVGRRQPP
jgi:DNA-binding CsgD family transcriptional regulator